MLSVSVVIVTHRSASTVAATLDAAAKLGAVEVIVVDNASPDDTVDVVRRNLPANGRLVEQDNVGFGAGNNAGVAALTHDCDLVLFLNPDATIEPDQLARLTSYLKEHPRVAMVAPSMRSGADVIGSAGRDATVATEIERVLPGATKRLLPRRPMSPAETRTGPVAYVEGACMLVRRSALAEAGGFDPGFFLFFEELDLARRLRANGSEVHVVTDAVAEHAVATSRKKTPLAGEQHFAASTYRYLAKWHGRRSAERWFAAIRVLWPLKVAMGRLSRADMRALISATNLERKRWR